MNLKQQINTTKIFIEEGIIVYIGKSIDFEECNHPVIELCIALNGKVKLGIEDNVYELDNFLINANLNHYLKANDADVMIILIDNDSNLGVRIKEKYKTCFTSINIDFDIVNKITQELFCGIPNILNIKKLISILMDVTYTDIRNDDRVNELIEIINNSNLANINIKEISKKVPISQSRLRHLFRDQVGISIQNFILWKKIKKAIMYSFEVKNLSEVAYLSDFSDYAHFSRTIKKKFGCNPRDFQLHAKLVSIEKKYN